MTKTQARSQKSNLLRKIYYATLKQMHKPYAHSFLMVFSFLESIIIPIPTDPLLLAKASAKPQKAIQVAFYTTLASVAGGLAGYAIGFYFWEWIGPFAYKYLFSQETFKLVASRVSSNTFLFVLLGGFTPLPFKAFALTAGSMSLPFLPFALGCLVGRGLRFMLLGGLIYFYGDSIMDFIEKRLEKLFLALGLLVALILGAHYLGGF